MKKLILSLTVLCAAFINAQVGINTDSPASVLDVRGSNGADINAEGVYALGDGILIPRVSAIPTNGTGADEGEMVYVNGDGFYFYDSNDEWVSIAAAAQLGVIANCSSIGFNGGYIGGIALSAADTYTVSFTNLGGEDQTIDFSASTPETQLVLSGAGLGTVTVTGVSPSSLTIPVGGSATVEYTLSGTPVAGDITGAWSFSGLSCSDVTTVADPTVANAVADFTFQSDNIAYFASSILRDDDNGSPTLSVREVGSSRVNGVVDNTDNIYTIELPYDATETGVYSAYQSAWFTTAGSFTGAEYSASQAQTVDQEQIRVTYPAGEITATGEGSITATIEVNPDFAGGDGVLTLPNLVTAIQESTETIDYQQYSLLDGSTLINQTNYVSIPLAVNGTLTGDVTPVFTGLIYERGFRNFHRFAYVPILATSIRGNTGGPGETTGAANTRVWLNNNLGAAYNNTENAEVFNPIQQAVSFDDPNAYGSLYQWGRNNDNHALMSYSSSTAGSSTINAINSPVNLNNNGEAEFGNFSGDNTEWFDRTSDADFDTLDEIVTRWSSSAVDGGPANPCPVGFVVATQEDFVNAGYTITGGGTGINRSDLSFQARSLKLTAAPRRTIADQGLATGFALSNGSPTFYWTSEPWYTDGTGTVTSTEGSSLSVSNQNFRAFTFIVTATANNVSQTLRTSGLPVRCITRNPQ